MSGPSGHLLQPTWFVSINPSGKWQFLDFDASEASTQSIMEVRGNLLDFFRMHSWSSGTAWDYHIPFSLEAALSSDNFISVKRAISDVASHSGTHITTSSSALPERLQTMFRNAGHQHGINILIPKNRIASRFRGHPGHHQYVLEWMVESVANDLGRQCPSVFQEFTWKTSVMTTWERTSHLQGSQHQVRQQLDHQQLDHWHLDHWQLDHLGLQQSSHRGHQDLWHHLEDEWSARLTSFAESAIPIHQRDRMHHHFIG